jgi:hypothetical protein
MKMCAGASQEEERPVKKCEEPTSANNRQNDCKLRISEYSLEECDRGPETLRARAEETKLKERMYGKLKIVQFQQISSYTFRQLFK